MGVVTLVDFLLVHLPLVAQSLALDVVIRMRKCSGVLNCNFLVAEHDVRDVVDCLDFVLVCVEMDWLSEVF